MSKKFRLAEGVVYSTSPDFQYQFNLPAAPDTVPPGQQNLRLQFEKRNGKPTTIVNGFVGQPADLEALAKKLKNVSGTGGSAKDGIILIQGDVREKLLAWFKKEGYLKAK
jgi:translation initiation factor 1